MKRISLYKCWVFIAQMQSTAARTQRPRVRIPLKPRKFFFLGGGGGGGWEGGLISQLLKLR